MLRVAWGLLLSATAGTAVCGTVLAHAGDLAPTAEPPGPPTGAPELVELAPVPPPQFRNGGDLVRVGGAVAVWARGFPDSPLFNGQRSFFPNFEGWLKVDYEWNANRVSFKPYARVDILGSRTTLD